MQRHVNNPSKRSSNLPKRAGCFLSLTLLITSLQCSVGYASRVPGGTIAPLGFDSRRQFVSPDGKYIAKVRDGEGEVVMLSIYKVNAAPRQALVLKDIWDVWGFVWVPKRPHTLVLGADSLYGTAMLALWKGGGHLHSLHRVPDSAGDSFILDGVSSDGKTIWYRYTTEDTDRDRLPEHRMRLPRG